MTAPDPNAPGTMVTSTRPEKYGEPFYVGNRMVVRCLDHPKSTAILVAVDQVLAHDREHIDYNDSLKDPYTGDDIS